MTEGVDLRVHIASMGFPSSGSSASLIADLELEVPAGGIAALVGRSGIGKTTLLRIIAGLERRFDGKVTLNGLPVQKPSRAIQIVYQDYRLLPWKTVRENIAFSLHNGTAAAHSIDRWLDFLHLRHRSDAWPRELSGGEQARTALARVFVSPPRVLLLDEAFHNLDVVAKQTIQEELVTVLSDQKITTVVVSHSIEDAVYLADVIYVLAESPMRVVQRIPVVLPRPRVRGGVEWNRLVEEVTNTLQNATYT
jgi:sulfonate transport system ATP-binding protein